MDRVIKPHQHSKDLCGFKDKALGPKFQFFFFITQIPIELTYIYSPLLCSVLWDLRDLVGAGWDYSLGRKMTTVKLGMEFQESDYLHVLPSM